MGFSIRSELASYARLKRRCYFLFVISYGGLLAGLTYAAMTHQSPPLWIGLIPGAALSVPLLLLPTQSWLPCLFHVLLGVVFAPIILSLIHISRRITVSTCGIKAGLRELGDSGLAFLAVSLHAPNQDLRAKIMPKAANWHLDDLMATLESYPLKTRHHHHPRCV